MSTATATDAAAAPAPATDPAWAALADARTADALCRAWLGLLCQRLLGTPAAAVAGLVLLAQADGAFAPVAAYPADRDLRHLRDVATEALRQRDAVQQADADGHWCVACPLLVGDTLHGAVVLALGPRPAAAAAQAIELVQWGAGWLVGLLHQRSLGAQAQRLHQGGFLLDTVLGLLAETTPREAALALVNRLGRELGSSQVHLALVQGRNLRLQALSHAAWFDAKAGLLRLATQAMHEALDQRRALHWPSDDAGLVTAAHRHYADEAGTAALVSLPLVHAGQVIGVLMLERARPFTADERAYLDALALGLAPALAVQRQAHAGALPRAARSLHSGLAWALGPRHPAAKLGVGLAALVLLLLGVVPVPFRINAPALVEGAVQRAAVAPFEGYLREAPARAGDVVQAGQLLARLDDRDLQLERARWEAELDVAQRKEREAMAAGNAVDQRLAGAQAAQARAQLDLALSKLERVAVVAPFDATVVKGDLSQQLGSPVEQGKLLFELAPLDAWRVILKVDERDIGQVRVGASGALVLASLPGQTWALQVRKLMPVSVAEEGHNHFRVEAALAPGTHPLSPNMEGVAKVDAGRASLLWIWSRPLVEWARLAWWRLSP